MDREVTYAEAGELIDAWGDRRIRPRVSPGPLDLSLEDACDGLAKWLADDPERDLSDVPEPMLRLFWTRLLYTAAVCLMRSEEIIGRVAPPADDELVLRALLGVQIAATRLPPEWHDGPPGGWLH